MYRFYVLVALIAAVSAGAHPRSDAALHHEAAPQPYDYAADPQYAAYYNQGYSYESNFIDRVKTSVDSFVQPLLTIDTAILGVALAALIVALNYAGIISFAPIIAFLQNLFGLTTAGKESRMFRVGRLLMGEELDNLSEIVEKAIDNVEKWKDL